MDIPRPYLLFLGDAADQLAIKTAAGVADWRQEWCVGQLRLPGCKADTGLPDLDLQAAVAAGVKTLVIGLVNPGGVLPEAWRETLNAALRAGLHVASGLHGRLDADSEFADAAAAGGARIFNLRLPDRAFAVGTGLKRSGLRLLTVGTDCSVGKKYTALALERDMRAAGLSADFVATGQTGILIAGRGVALDAVPADFISGAAEWLSPDAESDHWQVVEGQGSLFHPAFAGVTLGLLHGSQPDALVVCHEPTRTTMRNSSFPISEISDVIDLALRLGRLTNPDVRCVGLAVNTAALDEDEAWSTLARLSDAHNLPAVDPVRFNAEPIVARLQSEFHSVVASG